MSIARITSPEFQKYAGAANNAIVDLSRAVASPGLDPELQQPVSYTHLVAQRQLQYWSIAETKWLRPNGKRVVSVGGSSRDLRVNQTID